MISFRSIGFSTESDEVFYYYKSNWSMFQPEIQAAIIRGFEEEVQQGEARNKLFDELLANAIKSGYTGEPLKKFEHFMTRNKKFMKDDTVAFNWSLEYDENVMILPGTTYEKAVAFFKKKKKELDF